MGFNECQVERFCSQVEDGCMLVWLGSDLLVFLKASVSLRKSERVSIPFTVPKMSVMTRSPEAERRMLRLDSKSGHVARMCSRVWIYSPHGHEVGSEGTKEWHCEDAPIKVEFLRHRCEVIGV